MYQRILDCLKRLLTVTSRKKINTIVLTISVIAVCLGASYMMVNYLGPDNFIQNELEEVAEDMAEELTGAPDGSLNDEIQALFPHKKDKEMDE